MSTLLEAVVGFGASVECKDFPLSQELTKSMTKSKKNPAIRDQHLGANVERIDTGLPLGGPGLLVLFYDVFYRVFLGSF